MKSRIPKALILSRLIIGPAIIVFSSFHIDNYKIIAIILFTVGFLTDIFDGIIARQLDISTQKLRRLDSAIDQVFFISVAVATYIQRPGFFTNNALKVAVLTGAEVLIYLLSFLKFKKEIATHSIGAKAWTLFLFATLVQIILQGRSPVLFNICFWVGILTRLEIIAIILALKNWTNDVPSFYHSLKLRQGKEIKRHKIFNG
jgi:CDP-diacylglycerol--glycerol-3-phosphate 3-phosphatidyltransferase